MSTALILGFVCVMAKTYWQIIFRSGWGGGGVGGGELPSLTDTCGAFSLNWLMSVSPTGAAPMRMCSRQSRCRGWTSGLLVQKPSRGGAK